MSKADDAIEAIEELFLEEYAYTVTLEYMIGEGVIGVTVEDLHESTLAYRECDWTADDDLAGTIKRTAIDAIQESKQRIVK